MISMLLWKEYREHRIAWAALAAAGTALILGLPFVMAPGESGGLAAYPESRVYLCTAAVAIAWAYGLICGAMMLAGEREMGTLAFLDALPGLRRRLWLGKWLAGLLFLLAQTALLMTVLTFGRLFENGGEAALTLAAMLGAGLYGLAWGMFCSAFGRSVLNMILLGLAGQVTAVFVTLSFAGVMTLLLGLFIGGRPEGFALFSCGFLLLTIPLLFVLSATTFTVLDRNRLHIHVGAARVPMAPPTWSAIFWLTWRQARGFAAGMGVFALLLGFLVLYDGLFLWPIMTLLIGVLCGATAFADEQQGPFRFLGDQRFPLGKVWLVKIGVRFAIATAAALVVFLPSFFAALGSLPQTASPYEGRETYFIAHLFHSMLLATVFPQFLFLTLWLVHGFCAGCLCGLLFRSGLASGVFGLFVGVVLSAVWIPSLLEGGIHAWQVMGPPLLVLLAARLVLRPWAAGRIVSWTTTYRLAPCLGLIVLWIAAGIGYRVIEIPDVPAKYDLAAFRASLPKQEDNQAGDLIRRACLHFETLKQDLDAAQQQKAAAMMGGAPAAPPAGVPAPMPAPPGQAPNERPKPSLYERASDVATTGWPADDAELAAWLDKLFAGDWVAMLKEGTALPPGMIEDLRNVTIASLDPAAQPAREIAAVLRARGLQRQAAGDDEAYVENLRVGLGLARAMRYHAPFINVLVSRAIEQILVAGLDRWLEKLNGRPDLIRAALVLLSDHMARAAEDEADQPLVNYLIARNTVDDSYRSLLQDALPEESWRAATNDRFYTQTQWVVLASYVPWEHDRQERILRLLFWGTDRQRRQIATLQSPLMQLAMLRDDYLHFPIRPDTQCRLRAMQLKLALRWYQADNGKPAETLEELIPKYLPAIPLDPYDDHPFRYRLSRGEEIEWPDDAPLPAAPPVMPAPAGMPPGPPTRKVSPGQGILWSVGPDKVDDGGHRQMSTLGLFYPGTDLIFLVPLPPKSK